MMTLVQEHCKVNSIKVRIKQHESSEIIYCSNISEFLDDDKGVSLCTFRRTSEVNWTVSDDIIRYNNFQILLDNFSSDTDDGEEEKNK